MKEFEEEARLKLAKMQEAKAQEPSKRRFANFRQSSPLQAPITSPPPIQDPIATLPSPIQRKHWPYEPTIPITISFEGGPVVWTLEGPNLEFWEEEKVKDAKQSMEEL